MGTRSGNEPAGVAAAGFWACGRAGTFGLGLLLAGCGERHRGIEAPSAPVEGTGAVLAEGAGAPWFEEVASQLGIRFQHRSGASGALYFPEVMAGGVALIDIDNDGDLDLYLVQSGDLHASDAATNRNVLYRNDGNRFVDISAGSGADIGGYGIGVATGDFDNDGFVDLYVTRLGRDVLLKNNGDGTFTDVTEQAGIRGEHWGAGAAFVDFDGDGLLDLFVVNYVVWNPSLERPCFSSTTGQETYCGPSNFDPVPDTLYRNLGNGRFEDVSGAAGLLTATGPGLGVVCGDFDGDGRVDIFVSNDGGPNHLWINQGGGRFVERALIMGCALSPMGRPRAGMGVAAVDLDDDLAEELLVVNMEHENDGLFMNERTYFTDRGNRTGIAQAVRPLTRFGVGMPDFDNDGRPDLFAVNGKVRHGAPVAPGLHPLAEPNLLARGLGGFLFEVVLPMGGVHPPLMATSRGAAFGDLDGDGGVDVVVVNMDGPVHVLKNVVASRGRWIRLRLLERHGRDALGAKASFDIGSRRVYREVRTAYSYLSANDPGIHVGLGDAAGIRDLRVIWPTGEVEAFGDVMGGGTQILRQGAGRPGAAP